MISRCDPSEDVLTLPLHMFMLLFLKLLIKILSDSPFARSSVKSPCREIPNFEMFSLIKATRKLWRAVQRYSLSKLLT